MIYKELSKTGEKLSSIGIGTWQLGKNPPEEIRAIKVAIENGVNFVDTAEIYGSEPIVNKAIKGAKNIFIATKVWPAHFHYDDVIRACDKSLKNLGVKQIDLYQLHWPNKFIPIEETMRAMESLVKSGKIRYVGVSNFDKTQLIAAQNAMKKEEIVSDQVEYSLMVRGPEEELLPYCKKQKISVIAYSPLGHGKLFMGRYKKLFDLLSKVGKDYRKTAAQIALNWLISKKEVFAIPKASSVKHAMENAGATSFKLKLKDSIAIDIASRKHKKKSLKDTVNLPLYFLLFLKRF